VEVEFGVRGVLAGLASNVDDWDSVPLGPIYGPIDRCLVILRASLIRKIEDRHAVAGDRAAPPPDASRCVESDKHPVAVRRLRLVR
jgi:hypothetical protein